MLEFIHYHAKITFVMMAIVAAISTAVPYAAAQNKYTNASCPDVTVTLIYLDSGHRIYRYTKFIQYAKQIWDTPDLADLAENINHVLDNLYNDSPNLLQGLTDFLRSANFTEDQL
jgi:hypothetical protein